MRTLVILWWELQTGYHPVSEIGQLKISVIRHTIKNTYCSGFVVYLRTSLTWPRDKLLFRFKRVHSGAGRWNLSWEMGELEFCAHNSVPTADLKSNAELWLALLLCAQFFWPMKNFRFKNKSGECAHNQKITAAIKVNFGRWAACHFSNIGLWAKAKSHY